jgi:inorganic pyrophosphatase
MKKVVFLLLLASTTLAVQCNRQGAKSQVDYYSLSSLAGEGINVVVEIPAGTNHKIEFNAQTGKFENDVEDGRIRVVDFLPYPGNYGFIPSTLMDLERGGDGDPLDVLLICESVPTGTVIEALPVAALLLKDRGQIDTKIIAVPIDVERRIITAANFEEFLIKYDTAKKIIEDWFLSYEGLGGAEFIGWRDDKYAWEEIRKWMLH